MEVMISKGLDFWFSVFLVMSVSAIRADSQLDSEGKHNYFLFYL